MSYREITDINIRLMHAEAEVKALRAELDEIYQIMASIGYTEYCHNRITTLRLDRLEQNNEL